MTFPIGSQYCVAYIIQEKLEGPGRGRTEAHAHVMAKCDCCSRDMCAELLLAWRSSPAACHAVVGSLEARTCAPQFIFLGISKHDDVALPMLVAETA